MNSAKSSVVGWSSLILAAGASFYFAKKSINERRREQELRGDRPTEKLDWRAKVAQSEQPRPESAGAVPKAPATQGSGSEAVSVSIAGPATGAPS